MSSLGWERDLPTTVVVGPHRYAVSAGDNLRADDDARLYGQIRYSDQEIRIDRDMQDGRARQTLMHEIVHAIDDAWGCKLSEKKVDRLATGILAVLRANPALVRFLTASADGE